MLLTSIVLFIFIFNSKAQNDDIDLLNIFDNILKISGNFEIPSYEVTKKGKKMGIVMDEFLGGDVYDYVVVGAGTAGAVLASRLSENRNVSVLVLEAGDSPPRVSEIPLLVTQLQLTKYNWDYVLEKQENFSLGMIDGVMRWPRGKALGGSSVINSMFYTRGSRYDYDRWAAMGNPGWSYQDVLPYFMKSENTSVKIRDPGYHNTSGYLNVQDAYQTRSGKVFVKAAMELGYPYVDYNGENQMGVSTMQVTLRDGRRCSSEKAFLRPARRRKNLVVLKNSFVTRVLVDDATKTAYGVEYVRKEKTFVVKARKEVILSAGVLGSPQILMLSGIGPRDHLEEMKIPLTRDLPVGNKIYDHPMFLGLLFSINQSIVILQDDINLISVLNFTLEGGGVLSSIQAIEAILFMKTHVANYNENYPDIELMFVGSSISKYPTLVYKHTFNLNQDVYDSVWKNSDEKFIWSVFILLLHPKSYGHLRLRSTNPFDKVRLHGNYFTDPENQDMRTMIAAIREVQKISKTMSFQKYHTRQVKNIVFGCEHLKYDSDDYWDCAIRRVTNTVYHQTTTCKMGPSGDPEAVVDNKFRVHGVDKLRVVDASTIPITLSGHTNAPSFMIAEKASDLILEDVQ
ncbi:hypothetical protein FQR65_LT05022 [Abscondita terminalis]|nr:hypothetical protein FQR65_LT05022 [Abscondita terminalis]